MRLSQHGVNMSREMVGRPMEILLVEDGLTDACLTMGSLKNGGVKHRLTLMRDGVEALEFLNQSGMYSKAPRPDLILLDLNLPRKDGHEVLSEIKADFDLQAIPVVVLTSSMDEADALRCNLLHVDAYMTKPVDLEQFLQVVKKLKRFWMKDVILPATI